MTYPIGPFRQDYGQDIGDFVYVFTVHEHYADAKIYRIAGLTGKGTPCYEKLDADGDLELMVDTIEEANPYCEANVTFDGCIRFYFEECLVAGAGLHLCGRKHIQEVSMMMLRAHDLASRMIPKWGGK